MKARNLVESFRYSFEGIFYALKTQKNMRIHFAAGSLALLLAAFLGVPRTEFLILLLVIGLVIVAELANTSVEAVVDMVSPGYHPLARVAKNLAAACVLLSAALSLVVGGFIFLPRIIGRLGGQVFGWGGMCALLLPGRGRSERAEETPRRSVGALAVILSILIILNVTMLARSLSLLRLPGEVSELEMAREGARALIDYYEGLAARVGLSRSGPVRDALAKLSFEVERSATPGEVAYAISHYGRNLQDVIAREEENRKREIVLAIINQDPAIKTVKGRAAFSVSRGKDGFIQVEDKQGILSELTLLRLRTEPSLSELSQLVEVEVVDGKASLVSLRTMEDRVRLLQAEVDLLRSNLEDIKKYAGLSELTGPGVMVRVYDAPDGKGMGEVVQERDVRDIVNELFTAGALGVEVGGERLVAISSIRSAGPVILVNHRAIPVNPIEIRAVGNPSILASSLELMKNMLEAWGIRMEVSTADNLTLKAYQGAT